MLVGGVLGVVAIAAVGTQVIGGGGARPDGMRAGVNEGATFDSQVWFPDTDPPPSTTWAPRQPTTTVATLPEPEPQWVTTQVELSPSVGAMTLPTEVIALTESGTLISISIPSGEVHSIETEGFSSDTGLVLGARAIVLQSYAASTSTLARVGLPLTSIDVPTGLGFVVGRPGGDEFVVFANQVSPSSIATPFLLSGDGTLTEIVDGPFADTNAGASRFLPTGETIVFDTGGLYVVDASGASRLLTSGDLVATGPTHYLLRECDDDRNCGYVRVDAVTGDRSPVTLGPSVDYANASLSPDGTAMSYVEYGDEAPLQRIVDLSTGAMTELDTARTYDYFGSTENMWAADSSGVFAINNTQLTFFDRATGEATPVVPNVDFGDIVVVAARPLAAPATP